jgi:hypothetical protein
MVGEVLFEKAKAFERGSDDWKKAIEDSAARHKEIAGQYRNKAAGVFAELYRGRNCALLGKGAEAIEALDSIFAIQDQKPLVLRLKAQALGFALPVRVGDKEKKLPALDDKQVDAIAKFALAPIKAPLKLDADWLAAKYWTAALLDARADGLPGGDKPTGGRRPQVSRGRWIATFLAGAILSGAVAAVAVLDRSTWLSGVVHEVWFIGYLAFRLCRHS